MTRLCAQTIIRSHMRQLMGRREQDSPWTGIVADDLDPGYNSETALNECCTAEHFRIHITGNATSSWNRSCGRVFAASFLQEYPEYDKDLVYAAWQTHLHSLQGSYKLQLQPKDEKEVKKADRRCKGRKDNVCGPFFISAVICLRINNSYIIAASARLSRSRNRMGQTLSLPSSCLVFMA